MAVGIGVILYIAFSYHNLQDCDIGGNSVHASQEKVKEVSQIRCICIDHLPKHKSADKNNFTINIFLKFL